MTRVHAPSAVGAVVGPVFRRGDAEYAEERAGFQTAAVHRPTVIVGAVDTADVQAAVRYAATSGQAVGIQATGHGMSAPMAGGVLISTRRMAQVRVDAEARTAWLAAGVRWDQVITEAARHGLAPLNGSAPGAGAVSYTLGGGLGLLAREHGYAADHVRRLEIVTADGRLRAVTAEQDPDLFWAVRGGRGNFGVVTGMEIGLVPLRRIYAGGLYFDGAYEREVLPAYLDWTRTLPDEVTSSLSLIEYPDLAAFPEPLRGRRIVHIRLAYSGSAVAGRRLVAPLRQLGPRLLDTMRDMPYRDCGAIYHDPTAPHAYYGTNAMLADLPASVLPALLELTGPRATVPCVVDVRHLGGALARPAAVPNAVGLRDARYLVRVLTPLAGSDSEPARPVHRAVFELLAPWFLGRSLNFMYGNELTADEVASGYDAGDYRKLRQLKAIHDPTEVFRCHHLIPPAQESTP